MGNGSEKTNVNKSRKMMFAVIIFFLVVSMGLISYLSGFHIDLSQKYRSIEDHENIIFKDSWDNQCYRLCSWGLVKTEDVAGFEDHRNPDTSSYEYQLLVEKAGAEWIEQIVPSPNGKYILYVERIYRGIGTTDDEDVYYKVYSIDDDTNTTIYSGYRQFLLVDWE